MSPSFLLQFTVFGLGLLVLLILMKSILFWHQHAGVKTFRNLFHFSMIEIMDAENKNQKGMHIQNVLTSVIVVTVVLYVGSLLLLK